MSEAGNNPNDDNQKTDGTDGTADFEPLTATYERLRHSDDSAALSEFARRPLPDRSDQAAFSRATALLEAVAETPTRRWRIACSSRDHAVPEHPGQTVHRRIA